ncbi:MAG: hypothetical protein DSY90_04425 [Deltaproteobacteria bacterium]|nr:MAG: hypothetical protein DSY90_04425 [Deltaproteobacteria bacterium]
MRLNYKKILATTVVSRFIYQSVCMYGRIFHLKIENESPWLRHLDNGGKILLCAWHQQFFPAIGYFKKYQRYAPHIMISSSRDGEIIANIAKQAGWDAIRGSSSRGGKKALRHLIHQLKKTRLAAHIVDGPRGPLGNVKPGAIRLAHLADAAIVPFYVFTDRAWVFNSWDRFFIPKPAATVFLRFGDMIKFEAPRNAGDFESQRQYLEKTMRPGLIP